MENTYRLSENKIKLKEQSFIRGALILSVSMVITKIIGAVFKIPLAQILGGSGMGYFNTAYMLFAPVLAVSSAGLPVAMSKMVASFNARGEYKSIKKLMLVCVFCFFVLGITGTLAMVLFAGNFVKIVENQNSFLAVVAISPAIFFGCMMSAYRGYYEGLKNMSPTAISQVIEGVVKLLSGLLLAQLVINAGMHQYAVSGIVFSHQVSTLAEAQAVILPYAAAAAILGVSLSTLAGFLYLFVGYKFDKVSAKIDKYGSNRCALSSRLLLRELVKIAFPVTVGALIANLTSLIDLVSIMSRLSLAFNTNYNIMIEKFGAYLPQGLNTSQDMSNFLYGSYTGFAITIFHLVPAFTMMLGKSALPLIAEAHSIGDKDTVSVQSGILFKLSALVSVPAGIGVCFMAKPVLLLLFSSRPNEVIVAAPSLAIMGIGIACVAMVTPLFALLQALGRADLPVKFIFAGGFLKLIINFSLIGIPDINIAGAALGTSACYLIICILTIYYVVKLTGIKIIGQLISILFASLVCGISSNLTLKLLSATNSYAGENFFTVLALGSGGLFYVLCLFLTGSFKVSDFRKIIKKT